MMIENMTDEKLTISRIARLSGIGIETVRYYQRIGLIEEPSKPKMGYRIYSDATVHKLKFILRAKNLGFTLQEIKELLALDGGDCRQTQEIAHQKKQLIQHKIDDLQSIYKALEELLLSCQSNPDNTNCPIINTLSKD